MRNAVEQFRKALQFIPASDRDTWVRMGMGIKSEFGDSGFDVWDEWSRQDESYNAKDARDVWKSICANGKVTGGTIIHEARARGWRDEGTYQAPATPEERADRRRDAGERAAREEAETTRERAEASRKAQAIWKNSEQASADHAYLYRKRVSPTATLREIDASAAAAILGRWP